MSFHFAEDLEPVNTDFGPELDTQLRELVIELADATQDSGRTSSDGGSHRSRQFSPHAGLNRNTAKTQQQQRWTSQKAEAGVVAEASRLKYRK